jgi:hypothetical protein
VALEHDLTLLHNDQDYEKVATVRSLKHKRLDPNAFVMGERQ